MESKRKISAINLTLIILLVLCFVLGGILILLSTSKAKVETIGESGNEISNSYTITEETASNTWDISVQKDGSVIATLSDDGILTISGSGDMKDWSFSDTTDWHYDMEWKVTTVIIESGVTNIGDCAFYGCFYLTNIEIPSSVTSIGNYAFEHCSALTSIEIPDEVIKISDEVFAYCSSLTSIEIPRKVTRIGSYAFYKCSNLESVDIKLEEDVIAIDEYAFYGCSNLTSINIPEGTRGIGDCAFFECSNLKSINIPSSVVNIGNYAFAWCSSLTNIEVSEDNEYYMDDNGVLYTKEKTKIIKYPEANAESEYTILNGTTTIGTYAFCDCDNLTNINIPDTVTEIESNAFYSCDNFSITCKSGTTAETYAIENNINYLIIIDRIKTKTTVSEIKESFQNGTESEIIDLEGNIVTDTSTVGTGYKVKTGNGENYIIIVTGDSNGDGQADFNDILGINKHRLNKASLTGEYLLAGDVNEDGEAHFKDILQINKFRLGKIQEL